MKIFCQNTDRVDLLDYHFKCTVHGYYSKFEVLVKIEEKEGIPINQQRLFLVKNN